MICGVLITDASDKEGDRQQGIPTTSARKCCVAMMGVARSHGGASVLRDVHECMCVGGILRPGRSTNWDERGLCVGRLALGDAGARSDACWSHLRKMQMHAPVVSREIGGAMDGDFAACVVLQDRHFCIIRDAIGTRPIYYVAQPHLVAFATDLRALMHITPKHGLVQSIPAGSFMVSSQPGMMQRWYSGTGASRDEAKRDEQLVPAIICRSVKMRWGNPTFCVLLPNMEGLLLDDAVSRALRTMENPPDVVALCVGSGELFEAPYTSRYVMGMRSPTAEVIDGVQEARALLSKETLNILLGTSGPRSTSMDGMLGPLGVLWRCLLHVRSMAPGDTAMVLLPCASANLGEPMDVKTPPPSICHYLCGILGIMATTPLADLRFVEHICRLRMGDNSDRARRLLQHDRGRRLQTASVQCAKVLEKCVTMEVRENSGVPRGGGRTSVAMGRPGLDHGMAS